MTGQKIKDKALKRPDSFQDHVMNAINFLTANSRRILMMLTPIIVVGIVGYAAYVWNNRSAVARRAELSKILAMHNDELTAVNRKREETQKQINVIRSSKPSKDGKKTELSPENLATVTNLEKQIADLKPDHTKSMVEFKKFYESHKKNVEGWMAGLTWAGYQLQNGKSSDSRSTIEEIAKASSANSFYQMNSRFMLIGLLEDAGEFDAALKECDILTKIATDDARASVLLAKGRLNFFKKSFAESRQSLKEILEKHASSPEATKARGLIALMGSA